MNAPPLVPVPKGIAAFAVSVPRNLVARSDAPPLTTEVADGLGWKAACKNPPCGAAAAGAP